MLLCAICDIHVFNCANDNTACSYGDCTAEVIRGLEKVSSDMIAWFRLNEMKMETKFHLNIFNTQVTECIDTCRLSCYRKRTCG